MKSLIVKDLMVPLEEYATVSENASLYEAVLALEEVQELFEDKHTRYRHRAVLIFDKNLKIVGKLGQLDVLRALEPKYQDMTEGKGMQRYGFSQSFMKSMLKEYDLFAKPFEDICCKAGQKNVKEFMYTPSEGEYVSEGATLDKAIHQLVLGNHQSLLVTREDEIVGILRLTDLFAAIFHTPRSGI